MNEEQAIVYVIDDDESVREGVADLLRSVGHAVHGFRSGQEFLHSKRDDAPGCIVLDVRLPGTSGLEFQRTLTKSNVHLPIVFLSGHGDIEMSVRAIKSGAIEFLTKPVHEQQLLDAVQAGVEHDRERRRQARTFGELRERFDSLTPREREILGLISEGLSNKAMARRLGISVHTVKFHLEALFTKLDATSRAEAVTKGLRGGVIEL